MPFTYRTLTRWFRRQISEPLKAMYSGMDERLLQGQPEDLQPPIASVKRSAGPG